MQVQILASGTINQVVMRSSRIGDTKKINERNIIMTKEMVLTGLYARRNKLYRNGRNIKSPGVLRKIDRKIRQLQAAEE